MDRRSFLWASTLLTTTWSTYSRGQSIKKVPLVGVPLIAAGPTDQVIGELRQGLLERGYVDGQSIRIEYRSAEQKVERLPALMRELIQLDVAVIVAGAEPIVRAAMRATNTIPIIMVGWDYDPVAAGFVESLSRPGRNVTGIYQLGEETHAKRLELLKSLLPSLSRIGVLYDSIGERQLAQVLPSAKTLGLQAQLFKLSAPYDFAAAFKKAKASQVGALMILFSPIFYVNRRAIAEAALKEQLPTISQDSRFVRAGGLISYGPNLAQGWRRAAYFIDRVLKGARPEELPVEQADVYSLVINLKAAEILGVSVSDAILLRADEVVR